MQKQQLNLFQSNANSETSGNEIYASCYDQYVDEDRGWFPKSSNYSTLSARDALSYGPLWQGLNVLASDVGQVPFHLMRQSGEFQEINSSHDLDLLVSERPNPMQTASVFYETLMWWALLYGNGIAEVERVGGSVSAIWPLHPELTWQDPLTRYTRDPLIVTHEYWGGPQRTIDPINTIHIRGLADDGFWGFSLLELARRAINYGIALDEHGNAHFRNGCRPYIALTHPQKIKDQTAKNIRRDFMQIHSGAHNTGVPAVLYEGLGIETIQVNNEEAQWLDAKLRDREFVASLLNLPSFKLNAMDNSSTRANLEEMQRNYLNSSLARWLNRFVEEFNRKLMIRRNRETTFFKSFPETHLRGDQNSRYRNHEIGIGARFLTPNEARKAEGLNPLPGGDELANPAIDTVDRLRQPATQENDDLENRNGNNSHLWNYR